MPNGSTHKLLGVAAAIGAAAVSSRELPDDAKLAYRLGASIGGLAGGIMPDVLEPPMHPHHRGACHSVAITVGIGVAAVKAKEAIGAGMLAEASRLRLMWTSLPLEDPRRTGLWLHEMSLHLLRGMVLGFVVGYTSHVLADMTTARSVPLISRTFI